jgi:hypothetical protein
MLDSSTKPDTYRVSGIGYVRRIVIEWAQRNCRERKELLWKVDKGKSKKTENNHTDKRVNVDVEDFSKELPQ